MLLTLRLHSVLEQASEIAHNIRDRPGSLERGASVLVWSEGKRPTELRRLQAEYARAHSVLQNNVQNCLQ